MIPGAIGFLAAAFIAYLGAAAVVRLGAFLELDHLRICYQQQRERSDRKWSSYLGLLASLARRDIAIPYDGRLIGQLMRYGVSRPHVTDSPDFCDAMAMAEAAFARHLRKTAGTFPVKVQPRPEIPIQRPERYGKCPVCGFPRENLATAVRPLRCSPFHYSPVCGKMEGA